MTKWNTGFPDDYPVSALIWDHGGCRIALWGNDGWWLSNPLPQESGFQGKVEYPWMPLPGPPEEEAEGTTYEANVLAMNVRNLPFGKAAELLQEHLEAMYWRGVTNGK